MSLFALPVTASDLTTLQSGIQFFTNLNEANGEVTSINAPGTTTDSVFIYATKLLQNNISLSQVAMAVGALMEGGGLAVTGASNSLTSLSTGFLPGQVATALANNFNPTVFAAESLGSALSTQATFIANFVGLNTSQFSQSVANLTGVNVNAIQQFVANWTAFFSGPGASALQGRTVAQASYGAAFGDAVGVALLNPTTANLQTQVSTTPGVNPFTPNTIAGLVANALIDVAEGTYKVGSTLNAQPIHQDLQGEASATQGGVFLTQGLDTPNSGFSLSPLGTPLLNGFTATAAGVIFQAPANVTPLGIAVNTLNSGDNLQDTVGDGVLNLQEVALTIGANPPFATNVQMNGLKVLNISNQAALTPGGFQGTTIIGLQVENNNASIAPVTLGGTGQGLGTLLTNINITGYGGAAGDDINTVVLAAALGDATKTINVAFTGGNLGTTALGKAQEFAISNDLGGGTAAAPNLTYGTWALTINNNANLQLEQSVTTDGTGAVTAEGGVGGATTLSLTGKGNIAVGSAAIGDWRLLQTLNAAAEAGTVIITGATAGNVTNAKGTGAAGANPFWLFGSDFGLLDNTGTGAFALKEFDLGSGLNILDVSTATAAQITALKTVANAVPSPINEIIVQDSVATTLTAATFANIAGFNILGIGGPTVAQGAAGVINMANLPASINDIFYQTKAAGSVVINNQVAALTVDVENNTTGAQSLTVGLVGPAAGFADSLTVITGNDLQKATNQIGNITAFGDEIFTLNGTAPGTNGGSTPGTGVFDGTGLITLVPSVGGNEVVTLGGTTNLSIGFNGAFTGAILDATGTGAAAVRNVNNLNVTITNTAETVFFDSATPGLLDFQTGNANAPFITYSTNAVNIDASKSGGLFMIGGDANFVPGATVAATTGDTITGSAAPIGVFGLGGGVGDLLGGSIGNDSITSKSMTLPDFIYTDGGTDKITLAAGHTGADHVEFYAGDGPTAGVAISVTNAITTSTAAALIGNPGWWGAAGGSAGVNILALANKTGVSTDLSIVTGFTPGTATAPQDIVDFSTKAWGFSAFDLGLGQMATVGPLVPVHNVELGNVHLQVVNPGDSLVAGTNFLELGTGTFLNVASMVDALATFYNINHGAIAAGQTVDFLVAWADSSAGNNVHISDVNLQGAGTHTGNPPAVGQDVHIVASDIVQLTGVSLAQLTAANVHIVA